MPPKTASWSTAHLPLGPGATDGGAKIPAVPWLVAWSKIRNPEGSCTVPSARDASRPDLVPEVAIVLPRDQVGAVERDVGNRLTAEPGRDRYQPRRPARSHRREPGDPGCRRFRPTPRDSRNRPTPPSRPARVLRWWRAGSPSRSVPGTGSFAGRRRRGSPSPRGTGSSRATRHSSRRCRAGSRRSRWRPR